MLNSNLNIAGRTLKRLDIPEYKCTNWPTLQVFPTPIVLHKVIISDGLDAHLPSVCQDKIRLHLDQVKTLMMKISIK